MWFQIAWNTLMIFKLMFCWFPLSWRIWKPKTWQLVRYVAARRVMLVDLIVWRDKKRIALISTCHGLTTTTCHDITKPALLHDYNICMRGVDKMDQLPALYLIERKRNKVWYKKFFRRLLNVSVLNAYIMLKSNGPMKHRSFRKTLVNQLLKHHNTYTPKVK